MRLGVLAILGLSLAGCVGQPHHAGPGPDPAMMIMMGSQMMQNATRPAPPPAPPPRLQTTCIKQGVFLDCY